MGRTGLTGLGLPKRPFRRIHFGLSRHGKPFESISACKAEDARRVVMLRQEAARMPPRIDVDAALNLADQLDYRDEHPPCSLASSLRMRRVRTRVGGHLWKLAQEHPSTTTATIFPDRKRLTREELRALHSQRSVRRLRAMLNRAGAAKADGYLIAVFHCEFDRTTELFQPHFHIVAAGGMIQVLNSLRGRRSLKWLGSDDPVRHRLRITRKPLTHLPFPLLYLVQGWWPARARYGPDDVRFGNKSQTKGRIPEPFHSEYLLWLDRCRLADLTLMMRIEVVGGQEDAVKAELVARGFVEVPRRNIRHIGDAPNPGEFCPESLLGTTRGDVIVTLRDRRVMAIECKASNSSVNSFKRLNHEALGKAAKWTQGFGPLHVVPAAVLSGVFAPANVEAAQGAGLAIYWQNRIADLGDFLEAAR